jgi:hypothetical protein
MIEPLLRERIRKTHCRHSNHLDGGLAMFLGMGDHLL